MITFVAVMMVLGLVAYISYLLELRAWNSGTCRKTGDRWRFLTMDSSGARCYHDGNGNEVWISWNIEKR